MKRAAPHSNSLKDRELRPFDQLTPEWRHRLFVAYAVTMILVFVIPTPNTGVDFGYIDKAVHFGLFFGFVLMFYLDRRVSPWRILLVSAALAAVIELVQWGLPFRDVEPGDFLAEVAGAGLVTLLLLLARTYAE